jgi:hypothetical protein
MADLSQRNSEHLSKSALKGFSMAALNAHIPVPCWDGDSYRCAISLRSELRLVETLLNISEWCLCPKLKTHATELHERKVKLDHELKIRWEEENLCA